MIKNKIILLFKMVYENRFSVKIISDFDHDKLKRGQFNYVILPNGTEYKILLINERNTDAMAEIELEGESIGIWFVPANDSITIERPSDVSRKFTFFVESDPRADNAGVVDGHPDNGLVKVTFYPKKEKYLAISPRTASALREITASPSAKFQSGSTVLGDRSYQTFKEKSRFKDSEIDWNNKTEIVLRLIAKIKRYDTIKSRVPPRIDNYY